MTFSALFVGLAKFGDVPDVLPSKQPLWDRPGVLEDGSQPELGTPPGIVSSCFLRAQRRLVVHPAQCTLVV